MKNATAVFCKALWQFLQVSEKNSSDMDSTGSSGSSRIANIMSSEDSDDDPIPASNRSTSSSNLCVLIIFEI